jgi:multidrug resistance protein, MATE family
MRRGGVPFSKKGLPLLVLRGALGALYLLAYFFTIAHIPLGDASILAHLSPIFAILLSSYFLKERMSRGMLLLFPFFFSLIAEVGAILFGSWVIVKSNKVNLSKLNLQMLLEAEALLKMVKVNRDLFLRTVCLLTMTVIFTAKGASMGEVIFAANAILLQIHYIMAYLLGGFANASSILVGRAIGGKNEPLFKRAYTLSVQWGLLTVVLLAFVIIGFGSELVSFFTTITLVQETAISYLVWMVVFPIVGFWGLLLEGVFSGATEARPVRNSMFMALIPFLVAIWLLVPHYENQGIWIAFVLFSLGRSVFLWLHVPKLIRKHFSK